MCDPSRYFRKKSILSGDTRKRPADDAAGLAISEKMRKQIRGLTQASRNAQDGISMVQIADGALAEVQDMLLRGTELSVKAANGTLSDDDRSYIQNEMAELKKEIDSVSKKTKFNEIYVLKGNGYPVTKDPDTITITGSMPGWAVMSSTTKLDGTYKKNQEFKYQENGQDKTDTITIDHASASIDFSAFTPDKLQDLIGNGFYTTCCTCTNHYSIKFTDDTASSMETSGEHYIYNIGIKVVTTAEELMERIIRCIHAGWIFLGRLETCELWRGSSGEHRQIRSRCGICCRRKGIWTGSTGYLTDRRRNRPRK